MNGGLKGFISALSLILLNGCAHGPDGPALYGYARLMPEKTCSDMLYRKALNSDLDTLPASTLRKMFMDMSGDIRSDGDLKRLAEMGGRLCLENAPDDEVEKRYVLILTLLNAKKRHAAGN